MFKKTVAIILLIVWVVIIFSFSNSNADNSNSISKGLISNVLYTFKDIFNIEDNEIQELTIYLNKPIRKLAHMTEYYILALLIFNVLKKYKYKRNKYILTLILCFIYSLFDEYHQTFIIGRTGQFIDCIIDTFGSSLYLITVYLISIGIKNSKRKEINNL